jgi:hypothetical protein
MLIPGIKGEIKNEKIGYFSRGRFRSGGCLPASRSFRS